MDVREKLVELLNGVQHYGTICTMSQMDDRYARIAQVPNTEVAESLIAHGVTVQEWISVKDRLPDESGEYVVLNDAAHQDVLMYSEKYKLFNACDFLEEDFALKNSIKVTHWMPLPKLPQPLKGE